MENIMFLIEIGCLVVITLLILDWLLDRKMLFNMGKIAIDFIAKEPIEPLEPYIHSKREELIASGIDPDSDEVIKNLSCNRCGHCCKWGPCYLSPEDLMTLSNYFKISPEQVIEKYLVWDFYHVSNENKDYFYLRPVKKTETETKDNCANFDTGPSYCIFLEIGNIYSCKIFDVRPRGAKTYFCVIHIKDENRKLIYLRENAIKDFLYHPLNPYPDGLESIE